MTAQVQLHPPKKSLLPQEGALHTDQLCTFFVNRCCVEVIDCHVLLRLHRVSCWAVIFWKLSGPKHRHIVDALEGWIMQICSELLIAEHGQPLFEGELKPISTGDAITGPIMKILMADHTFNPLKFAVSSSFSICQHQL